MSLGKHFTEKTSSITLEMAIGSSLGGSLTKMGQGEAYGSGEGVVSTPTYFMLPTGGLDHHHKAGIS